jgi:hypothetical protein
VHLGTRTHDVGSDGASGDSGAVWAIAAAEDPAHNGRAVVEAFAVDRLSGGVLWKTERVNVGARGGLGELARVARRPNGELLFQSVSPDGAPCSELVCARPDGTLDAITFGARKKPVLDAALGDLVLAHHEGPSGRVTIGAFDIDSRSRLLGRRSRESWSIETGDLGGAAAVYAGAGRLVARGSRAVEAIRT